MQIAPIKLIVFSLKEFLSSAKTYKAFNINDEKSIKFQKSVKYASLSFEIWIASNSMKCMKNFAEKIKHAHSKQNVKLNSFECSLLK